MKIVFEWEVGNIYEGDQDLNTPEKYMESVIAGTMMLGEPERMKMIDDAGQVVWDDEVDLDANHNKRMESDDDQ